MRVEPPLGLGPDLQVAGLAQLGEDEAAEESGQVTFARGGVPAHRTLEVLHFILP